MAKIRFEDLDLAPGDPVPSWIEDSCVSGTYCPSGGLDMIECPAGSWCPNGMDRTLVCDSLSSCPVRSGYQVNFIVPILAAGLTMCIIIASWVMTHAQGKAAAKCRASTAPAVGGATPARTLTNPAKEYEASASTRLRGLDFSFTDLSVTLPSGRCLLHGVSGRCPPAAVTAILGPSGCGKTTLMNTLRGHAPEGSKVSGDVRVAGALASDPTTATALRRLCGMVPQEDVIDRALTVREALAVSAQLRLPPSTDAAVAVSAAVSRVLTMLGLHGVADVVLGGGTNSAANVSGGQLKRVSIGYELVASPSAIFMDEPTSGLDSNSALELMLALKGVAATGVAIVAVIHQPRAEVWRAIDHVILMGRGGYIVWEGAPDQCMQYLTAQAGFAPPAVGSSVNPADYAMDAVSGILSRQSDVFLDGAAADAENGAVRAIAATNEEIAISLASLWESSKVAGTLHAAQMSPAATQSESAMALKPPPQASWLLQCVLQARRAMLVRLRASNMLRLYAAVQIILAVALSTGFSPILQGRYGFLPVISSSLQPFVPPMLRSRSGGDVAADGLMQMMFFVSVAAGTASGIAGAGLFSNTVAFVRRDVAAGVSASAFAVGRMATDLLIVGWSALLFASTWLLLAPSGPWWSWLAIYSGLAFAASGVGYVAGVLLSPASAAMLMTIAMLTFAVFSGTEPPLKHIQNLPIVNWAWYLSLGTPIAQATYITYTRYWRGVTDVVAGGAVFGFDTSDAGFGSAIGVLFGLGFMWRAVAIAACISHSGGNLVPAAVQRLFSCGQRHASE